VSKTRLDLPEPETPVTTISRLWGKSSEMFLRLWVRAPRMLIVPCTRFSGRWLGWKLCSASARVGQRPGLPAPLAGILGSDLGVEFRQLDIENGLEAIGLFSALGFGEVFDGVQVALELEHQAVAFE
jgi:hypothetical protein